MGKTRQRRESSYHLGYTDAQTGHHFRWAYHGYLGEYKRGYRDGGGRVPGDRIKWHERDHRRYLWALAYNAWMKLRRKPLSIQIPKYHR